MMRKYFSKLDSSRLLLVEDYFQTPHGLHIPADLIAVRSIRCGFVEPGGLIVGLACSLSRGGWLEAQEQTAIAKRFQETEIRGHSGLLAAERDSTINEPHSLG